MDTLVASGTQDSTLGCFPCQKDHEGHARASRAERSGSSTRSSALANLAP